MADSNPSGADEQDSMDRLSKYLFFGGVVACMALVVWAVFFRG